MSPEVGKNNNSNDDDDDDDDDDPECLLCARHCSQCFSYINLFKPPNTNK